MYLLNNSLIYVGLDLVHFQSCLLLYFGESSEKMGMYFSQELWIFYLTLHQLLILLVED